MPRALQRSSSGDRPCVRPSVRRWAHTGAGCRRAHSGAEDLRPTRPTPFDFGVTPVGGKKGDTGNDRAGVRLTITGRMLTDTVVEEEFDIKEEEPWFDKQDLEHGTVCRLSLSLKPRRKSTNYVSQLNNKNRKY